MLPESLMFLSFLSSALDRYFTPLPCNRQFHDSFPCNVLLGNAVSGRFQPWIKVFSQVSVLNLRSRNSTKSAKTGRNKEINTIAKVIVNYEREALKQFLALTAVIAMLRKFP